MNKSKFTLSQVMNITINSLYYSREGSFYFNGIPKRKMPVPRTKRLLQNKKVSKLIDRKDVATVCVDGMDTYPKLD